MTLIENPASPLVSELEGVHLFGFDLAPCSQRVSFALAEKGLFRERKTHFLDRSRRNLKSSPGGYIFRNVSLIKHDNMTESYAAIQPNLVVPALVHDGRLHIESMDIVAYLDEAWPENPLVPVDPAAAALCHELIEQAKDLHVSIRHVTFHWSLGKIGKTDAKTQATAARLQKEGSTDQLAEFYARFNDDEIDEDEFLGHLRALEAGYAAQEARLRSDGRPFLTGDTFSSADIIWAIKVLRLSECCYPLARNFPLLNRWFEAVRARPGFQDGVIGNHRFFHHAFRFRAAVENLLGMGISSSSRQTA